MEEMIQWKEDIKRCLKDNNFSMNEVIDNYYDRALYLAHGKFRRLIMNIVKECEEEGDNITVMKASAAYNRVINKK